MSDTVYNVVMGNGGSNFFEVPFDRRDCFGLCPRNDRVSLADSSERGQVAILFALTFTFMFLLFAMVIDLFPISLLIKLISSLRLIPPPNAGAAWQARTLNQIGHQLSHAPRREGARDAPSSHSLAP